MPSTRPLSPELHQFVLDSVPGVSRTFAIGIAALREPLREQIACAYLLCRVLDTVEDDTCAARETRIEELRRLGGALERRESLSPCAANVAGMFASADCSLPDRKLCRDAGKVFAAFDSFSPGVREAICGPAAEMAYGMASTLERQAHQLPIESLAELDRYCYYVAGTVGILLSNLFSLDRLSDAPQAARAMRERAVSFGIGLQLVNILKDVTNDLSRGVVYLPADLLRQSGADLELLIDRPSSPPARVAVARLVRHALGHLDNALDYTLAIPPRESDIREFCLLPLFFALGTCRVAMANGGTFDRDVAVKLSRAEVASVRDRLLAVIGDDARLRETYDVQRRQLHDALEPLLNGSEPS